MYVNRNRKDLLIRLVLGQSRISCSRFRPWCRHVDIITLERTRSSYHAERSGVGYVYLIFERDCFGKDGAKFLKIGCTSTPKSAARPLPRIEKEADRGSQNAAENYKGKWPMLVTNTTSLHGFHRVLFWKPPRNKLKSYYSNKRLISEIEFRHNETSTTQT